MSGRRTGPSGKRGRAGPPAGAGGTSGQGAGEPAAGEPAADKPAADKPALRAELLAQLAADLDGAERAHAAAIEGATHTEARPENSKDTRGLEQSYLARGQAQRVAELRAGIAAVAALTVRRFGPGDPIALGALVTVDEDGVRARLYIAPHGGGHALAGGVQVVTPSSPLGRALVGKQLDDEAELRLPGRTRSLCVVAIA